MYAALELDTRMVGVQSLLDKYGAACKTINSQMPEITIALHERVESYIKELQVHSSLSDTFLVKKMLLFVKPY